MKVEVSKGSVFHDLFDDPLEAAELALKAQLGARIREVIEARKLTQAAAAKLTGLTQPNVSRIVNYKFHEIGVERLFRALVRLGVDVRIALPAHEGGELGTMEVVAS